MACVYDGDEEQGRQSSDNGDERGACGQLAREGAGAPREKGWGRRSPSGRKEVLRANGSAEACRWPRERRRRGGEGAQTEASESVSEREEKGECPGGAVESR